MKKGHSERPIYEYHLAEDKLQESICDRDLGVDTIPSLSPKH